MEDLNTTAVPNIRMLATAPGRKSMRIDTFQQSWRLGVRCMEVRENGKRGVLGRICWCVACYVFLLLFNVFSLLLMFYVWGVLGFLGSNFSGANGFKMRWMIVAAVVFYF